MLKIIKFVNFQISIIARPFVSQFAAIFQTIKIKKLKEI